MIMMEEFKRRKILKDYHQHITDRQRKEAQTKRSDELLPMDMHPESLDSMHEYHGSNVERYFEPK